MCDINEKKKLMDEVLNILPNHEQLSLFQIRDNKNVIAFGTVPVEVLSEKFKYHRSYTEKIVSVKLDPICTILDEIKSVTIFNNNIILSMIDGTSTIVEDKVLSQNISDIFLLL
jgi:hypothetical protein